MGSMVSLTLFFVLLFILFYFILFDWNCVHVLCMNECVFMNHIGFDEGEKEEENKRIK